MKKIKTCFSSIIKLTAITLFSANVTANNIGEVSVIGIQSSVAAVMSHLPQLELPMAAQQKQVKAY